MGLSPKKEGGGSLLPNTQLSNQSAVTGKVFLLQVSEVAAALTYQAQQRLPAAVVLTVALQVLAELLNAVSEKGDLALGGTGVFRVTGVLLEDFFNLLFG